MNSAGLPDYKDEHDDSEGKGEAPQDAHSAEQPSVPPEKPILPVTTPVHVGPPSPPTAAKTGDKFEVLPPALQQMGKAAPKAETPKKEEGKKEEGAPKKGTDVVGHGEKVIVQPSDVGPLDATSLNLPKKDEKKDAPKKVGGVEPPKAPPVAVGSGGSVPPKGPTVVPPMGGSPRGPNPNTLAGRFMGRLRELVGRKTFKEFDKGLRAARPELSDLEGQLKTVVTGATGSVRSSVQTIVDAFYADEAALRDSIRRVSEEHGLHLSVETFAAAREFYRTMLDQIHEINTPEHVYDVFHGSMTENVQFMDQRFPKFNERARAVVMAKDAKEATQLVNELVEDVSRWVLDQQLKNLPASLRDIPTDIVRSELTIALRAAHEMALIVKNTTDPALALEGMMGRPLSEEHMGQVRGPKDADALYTAVEGMTYKDVKGKEQTILTAKTGILYTFSDGNEKYVYGAGKGSLKDLAGDLKEGIVIDVRRWEDSLALKALATMRKGVTVRACKASDPTAVVEMSGEVDEKAFKSAVGVDHATFVKNPCKYLFDYQVVA